MQTVRIIAIWVAFVVAFGAAVYEVYIRRQCISRKEMERAVGSLLSTAITMQQKEDKDIAFLAGATCVIGIFCKRFKIEFVPLTSDAAEIMENDKSEKDKNKNDED